MGTPYGRWPHRPTPAYVKIAGRIRDEIKTGALQPDEQLPSAAQLCSQYEVSMITAKSAINLLRSEGLIYGIPGKGTYVAKNPRMIRTAPHRYFEQDRRTYKSEAERAGKEGQAEHKTTLVKADNWIAQRLEIDPGDEVVQTTYRIFADDKPMSMSVSWEPYAITRKTVIAKPHEGPYGDSGINARFAAIGWAVEQVEEHLVIREPELDERKELIIPGNVLVAEIRQTIRASKKHSDDLVPIEAADIVFPTDRYEFRYLMDRPREPGERS